VYLKLRYGILFLIALTSGLNSTSTAQNATTPVTTLGQEAVTSAVLHGHVTDPSGALIRGAVISIMDSAGTAVATTTADSAGSYEIRNLRPGSYTLQSTFTGFAPFSSSVIALSASQIKRLDIAMSIQANEENVYGWFL